jgi:hypothetical protein
MPLVLVGYRVLGRRVPGVEGKELGKRRRPTIGGDSRVADHDRFRSPFPRPPLPRSLSLSLSLSLLPRHCPFAARASAFVRSLSHGFARGETRLCPPAKGLFVIDSLDAWAPTFFTGTFLRNSSGDAQILAARNSTGPGGRF